MERGGVARRAAAAVMAAMLTVGCKPAVPLSAHAVDIVAPDGVTLKGTLFPAASSGPAVLLLHQCDDRRTVWDPLGPRLAAAGITALSIDYRGYGESGGTPHGTLSSEQQAAVTANSWPGDIDAAFAFLSRQSGVDPTRLGAAGGSCGVNNAIQLARRHVNVKALALLAGPADRDARTFLDAPGAPPVFTAAAADDRYADFVLVSSWLFGISPRTDSRFAQYRDGGHAAVIFRTHPGLADLIVQWFGAVLTNTPASLPSTNGVPLAPAVLQGLKAIDRPGGAAAALARKALPTAASTDPVLPEYIVNWLGYEHLALKDNSAALDIMKLNAACYPASPNAQDSLGDAYLAAGDTASALAAARRTLELLAADTDDTPQRMAGIRTGAEAKIARRSAR
jgi:dienelactone hydrolase